MPVKAVIGMALAGTAMLAACAHPPLGHRAVPGEGETITYRLQGSPICYGCATYSITLGPDGQGIFTGEHATAVAGDHRFRATPDQVLAFRRRLQEYRPNGEVLMTGPPFCKELVTDQDSVDVRWQGADEHPRHLAFYAGCDRQEHRKMAAALFSAPTLLPVADLIGRAQPPG